MAPRHRHLLRRATQWTAGGLGFAAAAYATTVGLAWVRYGHPAPARGDEIDPLLDRFMPEFEVAERHAVHVAASPHLTLAAAAEMDLHGSALIRAIFRARELVLGAEPDEATRPKGLLALTRSLGWGVLAEVPGREIVLGAVTQPWKADVVFRALPPDEFEAFREPDYVKIVWNLRADPATPFGSMFRTETRVATTSASARSKFRWYWARFSPGIILIRRLMLPALKADAERRMHRAEIDRLASGQYQARRRGAGSEPAGIRVGGSP